MDIDLIQYLTDKQKQEIQNAVFEKIRTQIKSQDIEINIKEILEEEITELITWSIKEGEFESLNDFLEKFVTNAVKKSLKGSS